MPDTDDQPVVAETDASAQTPAAPNQGIEAVMDRLNEVLDKRFSGFQGLMDRKLGSLATQFDEIRNASLTQEEREEIVETSGKQEIERLRMENQLYQLRADHADAVDLIMGAMGTSTLEEQIAFVESRIGKQTIKQVEAAVEAEAEGPATPEVDPNNPGAKPKLGAQSAAFGGVDSMEAADAILDSASRGSLARNRR